MSAVDNRVPGAADPSAERDSGIAVEVDTSELRDRDGNGGAPGSTGSAGSGSPEARIQELEAALARVEQEKKDNWDKYLRAVADLENFRKRGKRDLDDAKADARTKVLKEMLPVVDNLERAVEHAEKQGDAAAAIIDGVKLVLRQFLTSFERVDVTPVDAAGQPFDPNVHEAISQIETDESPPGTVVQVLQRGYRLGDRLLRPALVVVAKPKSGPQA
jgi:molecular chaperone GrpE